MRSIGYALLVLVTGSALAADVYRSVDRNGNVVYSDRPAGAQAERIVVAVQRPASRPAPSPAAVPAAEAGNSRETVTETAPERTRVEPTADERAQKCTQAQERATRYAESMRLFRTNSEGEREYLDDAQIDEARAKAAADVDNWCS